MLSEPLEELDSEESYRQFKFVMVLSNARSPKVVYRESFKGILDFRVGFPNSQELGEPLLEFLKRSKGGSFSGRRN